MSTQTEIFEVAEDSGVPVKVVEDFVHAHGYDAQDFQDHFMGIAEDGKSWIEEWYYDTGEIDKCPDPLKSSRNLFSLPRSGTKGTGRIFLVRSIRLLCSRRLSQDRLTKHHSQTCSLACLQRHMQTFLPQWWQRPLHC